MARIAIFCDGTWNSPTIVQPTHVVRLFGKTPRSAAQHTAYFEGVGSSQAPNALMRGIMKIGGGAFGWGLNDNIKRAYTDLCRHYRPGDQIFIFGFSRGAYTARSLAGMLRKCGVLEDISEDAVDTAFRLYRKPGFANHPDSLRVLEQRRRLSPRAATSQADMDWRTVTPSQEDPADGFHRVEIAYLGIWDTVGALGIPSPLLGPIATLWNARYRFHDTKLSSMVRAARHAVALDERRVFYKPTLWQNLEAGPDGPGLNRGDRTPARRYQQVWFTGTHAMVGGSAHKARRLTGQSLYWIAEGARQAGLEISMDQLLDIDPDPLAESETLNRPPWLYELTGNLLRWREGPGHPIDLHESALTRVKKRRDYRPRSLKNLMPELFGQAPIGQPARPDRPEPGR